MTEAELEERLLRAEGAVGALKLVLGDLLAALPKETANPLLEKIATMAAIQKGISTLAMSSEMEIMARGFLEGLDEISRIAARPSPSQASDPEHGSPQES